VAVADRRKLIVVSNRGPASYARNADGERVARRGGGGPDGKGSRLRFVKLL
jgi:hypothetical protein